MHIHNLSLSNSVLNHFLHQIRDETIQKDRMKFRRNIERIGEVLCYELSKTLHYKSHEFETPLSPSASEIVDEDLVVCSILRAGIPLHHGILNYFDEADSAYVSAYRQQAEPGSDEEFDIVVEYLSSPSLEGKTLLLADPMLATGLSMLHVLKALEKLGKPKSIHIISVVGAQAGVELIGQHLPDHAHLWIADIDNDLNEKGYIIPGLGDAGDLAFGKKL